MIVADWPWEFPGQSSERHGEGKVKVRIFGIGFLLLLLFGGDLNGQVVALSPGDSVVVDVRGQPQLSGRFRVNDFGDLLVPQGGVIRVSGLTLDALSRRISEGYRPYFGSLEVAVTTPALEEAERMTALEAERDQQEEVPEAVPQPDPEAEVVEDPVEAPVEEPAELPEKTAVGEAVAQMRPDTAAPPDPEPLEVSEVVRDSLPRQTPSERETAIPAQDTLPSAAELEALKADTVSPVPEPLVRAEGPEKPEPKAKLADPPIGNAVTEPVAPTADTATSPPQPEPEPEPQPRTYEPPSPAPQPYQGEDLREPPPPEIRRAGRSAFDLGFAVLGGVASTVSPTHGYGGLMGTAAWKRLGLIVLGQYGQGGGYSSFLMSGGVTYEAYRLGPISILGTAGYSYYSEDGDGGLSRSLPALTGGGILRLRIGPIEPSVALNGYMGSFEGDESSDSFDVSFVRVSFGVGF